MEEIELYETWNSFFPTDRNLYNVEYNCYLIITRLQSILVEHIKDLHTRDNPKTCGQSFITSCFKIVIKWNNFVKKL